MRGEISRNLLDPPVCGVCGDLRSPFVPYYSATTKLLRRLVSLLADGGYFPLVAPPRCRVESGILPPTHNQGYSLSTPRCAHPLKCRPRRSIAVPCQSACRCSSRCLPPCWLQRILTPVTITAARPAGSGPASSRRPRTCIYGRRSLRRCVACQLGSVSGEAVAPAIGERSSLRCQWSGASLEVSLPPRCVTGRHLGRPNHAPGGSACA